MLPLASDQASPILSHLQVISTAPHPCFLLWFLSVGEVRVETRSATIFDPLIREWGFVHVDTVSVAQLLQGYSWSRGDF